MSIITADKVKPAIEYQLKRKAVWWTRAKISGNDVWLFQNEDSMCSHWKCVRVCPCVERKEFKSISTDPNVKREKIKFKSFLSVVW